MIAPRPAPARYEHATPGDLLHINIKTFVRIVKIDHNIHQRLSPRAPRSRMGVPLRRRRCSLVHRIQGYVSR